MPRTPYAWEVQLRREILDDELAQLRELRYEVWRDALGAVRRKPVTGRDGRTYTVTVMATLVENGHIRVDVQVEGSRLRRERISGGFVVTPAGTVLD
ncbi:MAG TPA: hypothetical protein VNI83_11480 [Vicinamibacterales bacterium]|nr:hypothetical protein [Vicinamibacterales bacterium]